MPLLSNKQVEEIQTWAETQLNYLPDTVGSRTKEAARNMLALLADRQERIELAVALVSLVNQCVGSLELLAPDIAERKRQQLRELGGKVVCPGCSDDNDDCRCLRPGSKSLCSLCSYPDHHSPDPRYAALRNVLTEECGPDHDIVFDLNGCCRCQGTGYISRRIWEELRKQGFKKAFEAEIDSAMDSLPLDIQRRCDTAFGRFDYLKIQDDGLLTLLALKEALNEA